MPKAVTALDFQKHFERAQALISDSASDHERVAKLAEAQVHATLAHAAAAWLALAQKSG